MGLEYLLGVFGTNRWRRNDTEADPRRGELQSILGAKARTSDGQVLTGEVGVSVVSFDEQLSATRSLKLMNPKIQPELALFPGSGSVCYERLQTSRVLAGSQIVPRPRSEGAATEPNTTVREAVVADIVVVNGAGEGVFAVVAEGATAVVAVARRCGTAAAILPLRDIAT